MLRRGIALPIALLVLASCSASSSTLASDRGGATPAHAGPSSDPDPNHDGLTAAYDVCPCEAEDRDGFDDDDGCPDPDNDHDQIVDACDLCPNEAETYDGRCDADGCPETPAVRMLETRIEILQQVGFARGSDEPDAESAALLDMIAQALVENPQIALVAVLGQSERREPRREGLAQRRAASVLEALVSRGVRRDRLVAEVDPSSVEPGARRVRFDVRTITDGPGVGPGECGTPSDADCQVPVCDPPAASPPVC